MLGKESVELWDSFHKEAGEIFRLDTGFGNSLVVTHNPHHAQLILSHQGKDSVRTMMPSWAAIHRAKGWPTGIPWATGDDHRRNRQVLGETLLMQKNAKTYVPLVVPAANRYADCLAAHLNPDGRLPASNHVSLTLLTGMFALEAVMKVVVGVDYPALTYPLNQSSMDFVESVQIMFAESTKVEMIPDWHIRFNTQSYRRLTKAWETMVEYPTQTLRPVLEHYQTHGSLPPEVQGTVLPKLIAQYEAGDLSLDEVQHIGVQAIAAAVDTTAQTTEYVCYNLATNPDVQELLYQHLCDNLPGFANNANDNNTDLQLSIYDYERLKYLHAVLKESMRYTPTIGVHARTLTQDADLGDGYQLPKGQIVLINYLAMTRDAQLYPSPDQFLPERFLKGTSSGATAKAAPPLAAGGCPVHHSDHRQAAIDRGDAVHTNPYAAIPFGHGARKCAGKAFAEMDVHVALAALLRRYKIEYDGPPLRLREDSLLRPIEPLSPHFKFVPRQAHHTSTTTAV